MLFAIQRGSCGITWANGAVLRVKDDWKGQFWGLRYCLSKLRSLLSFSFTYDVTSKIAQFHWECLAPLTVNIIGFFYVVVSYWRKNKGTDRSDKKTRRRRKKLLDVLKDRRGYCELKEEAVDRTVWRNRFAKGFGPVVWQIADDDESQCRKRKLGGTGYRGPAFRKGARGPTIFHMFLSLSVVPLSADCCTCRPSPRHSATDSQYEERRPKYEERRPTRRNN